MATGGERIRGFKRGEEVEGVVTAIFPKRMYIDVDGKTEGVILGREFEAAKEFIRTLKVGEKVRVVVGNPESERGQILLNFRRLAKNYAWNFFEEKLKSGEEVEVQGRELNKGGLVVEAPFGLFGFIPGSQIGSLWQKKMEGLINRVLKVKVIEADRPADRLVFSEKQVSEAEKIARQKALLKKVKTGGVYQGEIVQVLPYGLLVQISVLGKEITGLVHISEISWEKIADLASLYKEKDKVKVKVQEVGDDRLSFSIRQLLPDPWEKLEEKYQKDVPVKGAVVRLASYGALVELEPGVEGLVHISKIPPQFKIDAGDKISCFVESIDRQNRRIALGLMLKEKPIEYK